MWYFCSGSFALLEKGLTQMKILCFGLYLTHAVTATLTAMSIYTRFNILPLIYTLGSIYFPLFEFWYNNTEVLGLSFFQSKLEFSEIWELQ